VTLAIPGTGSLAHLEDNIAAGSIALTGEDMAALAVAGPSKANPR
jgi:pyridoxine 4-dehydrogenase